MTDEERAGATVMPMREHVAARPIRKDEITIEERGLYVESWLPERRSRRRPLLMVHGELGGSWLWHRYQGYFAERGWEAHALNLRAHYWSDVADFAELTFDSFVADAIAAYDALPRPSVVMGHGMGGLLALKVAERRPVEALVLLSAALPAGVGDPAPPHVVRAVPGVFRRDLIGWQAMPEQLRRFDPDLTIADALRVQHMMGAESGAARQEMLRGVPVDVGVLSAIPTLVLGGGVDRLYPGAGSERLAHALGAEYVPFGAHSHYGLVIGESSYGQVADVIRSFLERHKL